MSRKRNSLKIKNRRAKALCPFYQASEYEILSDLRKLKYVTKKDKTSAHQKPCEQETEKPKVKEGNDRSAIEMLAKLQRLQESQEKKRIEVRPESKNMKPSEKGNCYLGHIENPWMNFDYKNYISNMVYMQNQGFGYYPMNMGFEQNSMMPGYYGFCFVLY